MLAHDSCSRMRDGFRVGHDEKYQTETPRPERVRKQRSDDDRQNHDAALSKRNAQRMRGVRRDRHVEQECCDSPHCARSEKVNPRMTRVGPDGKDGDRNSRKCDEETATLPTGGDPD